MRYCLGVEKTWDGQNKAGAPYEDNGNASRTFTHSRPQRVDDRDEAEHLIINVNQSQLNGTGHGKILDMRTFES